MRLLSRFSHRLFLGCSLPLDICVLLPTVAECADLPSSVPSIDVVMVPWFWLQSSSVVRCDKMTACILRSNWNE